MHPDHCQGESGRSLGYEDLWKAGGIPRVTDRLQSILHMDVMTCTGKSMKENIDGYHYRFDENNDLIKTMDEPFASRGGLVVLRGNLAPKSGVSKPTAIDPSVRQFTGTAVVFDITFQRALPIK